MCAENADCRDAVAAALDRLASTMEKQFEASLQRMARKPVIVMVDADDSKLIARVVAAGGVKVNRRQ